MKTSEDTTGGAGMIVLPASFGETAGIFWADAPAIEVGLDPSRQAEAGMLQGLIMQAMGELVASRFQDPASMQPLIADAREQVEAAGNPLMATMLGTLETFLGNLQTVQDNPEAGDDGSQFAGLDLANIKQIDVTQHTYYRWRKEYGGLRLDQAKRLRELERENARLKKLVADQALDNAILKEVAEGNF